MVTDFYTGDVEGLTERLLAADLSLVVYYAAWDRASQTLRWEVERAAQYHHEQVSVEKEEIIRCMNEIDISIGQTSEQVKGNVWIGKGKEETLTGRVN